MKKFLVSMMLAVAALSVIADGFARPMGSGRSFGRQSSSVSRMRAPAPSPYQQPAPRPYGQYGQSAPAVPQAPLPQRRPSMWKGVLGGALVGLGLGALASHFGFGGAMASGLSSILMLVLLALAVMFIVRMFRRKDTPANPGFQGFNNPMAANATPEIGSGLQQPGYQPNVYQPDVARPNAWQPLQPAAGGVPEQPHAPWGVPAGFDTDAFLRQAKSSFIRMQAAWDKGDVQDLREFTTPEVFAELKTQILERGGNADFTDVVSIDAQLLGIETSAADYLASVQFNGMIRNAPSAPAEPFAEVWNMVKPISGNGGWLLAGIQQLS
jgi:predicted lipid-binding transport protein (Tim44 family)